LEKSRDAFRTISEVAEWLDVPTHVLRFWESRFTQIKPVKRAGGRRYYRPSDMRVIGGVKTLLHDQGMTIRGVQKLFREKGIKHISGHAPVLYGEDEAPEVVEAETIDHAAAEPTKPAPAARSTRHAEPDPIIDDLGVADKTAGESTPEVAEAADSETDKEGSDAPEAEPVLQFSHSSRTPAKQPETVAIEVPAHVPKTDPQDDDAAHAATAGVAAQLRALPAGALVAHRDIVAAAVEKLKALRARAD
jgi:DNA-binding transcriptional MerR regulator